MPELAVGDTVRVRALLENPARHGGRHQHPREAQPLPGGGAGIRAASVHSG